MEVALLEVQDLHVSFSTDDGVVQAVRGLAFAVDRGETLGIVGESGSGKSVATQTITGLTRGARVTGRASFDGNDLLKASDDELREVRGVRIGMIFQDPLSSLHPAYRVGWQIVEMIRAHDRSVSRQQARERAAHLLGMVGIPHAADRIDDYLTVERGQSNPFLHLSMHLSIAEQISIDQPSGIRAAFSVPVLDRVGNCLGSLACHFRETWMPSPHAVERGQLFAQLVAAGLGRERGAAEELPPPSPGLPQDSIT